MDPSPNPNHPATPHQVDDIVVELGRRDADAHDLCVQGYFCPISDIWWDFFLTYSCLMLIVYNTSLSLSIYNYIYVYPCAYVCVHVAVVELDGDIEFTHEIPGKASQRSREVRFFHDFNTKGNRKRLAAPASSDRL